MQSIVRGVPSGNAVGYAPKDSLASGLPPERARRAGHMTECTGRQSLSSPSYPLAKPAASFGRCAPSGAHAVVHRACSTPPAPGMAATLAPGASPAKLAASTG